jgi:hypothetical protein
VLDGDTTVSSAGGGHEAGGEAALITSGASGMGQSEAMIRVKQDLERQLGKGTDSPDRRRALCRGRSAVEVKETIAMTFVESQLLPGEAILYAIPAALGASSRIRLGGAPNFFGAQRRMASIDQR